MKILIEVTVLPNMSGLGNMSGEVASIALYQAFGIILLLSGKMATGRRLIIREKEQIQVCQRIEPYLDVDLAKETHPHPTLPNRWQSQTGIPTNYSMSTIDAVYL